MAHEEIIPQPIYQPLKDTFKPGGIPLGKLIIIAVVCFVGFLTALLTADVTHNVEVEYTANERGLIANDYKTIHSGLVQIENMREQNGVDSVYDLSLTSVQEDILKDAQKYGITVQMSNSQLEDLVPKTHIESQPVLPDGIRYFLGIGLPLVIGIAFFKEINRTSLSKFLALGLKYSRSQKMYHNEPMYFVEQETGKDYWQATQEVK